MNETYGGNESLINQVTHLNQVNSTDLMKGGNKTSEVSTSKEKPTQKVEYQKMQISHPMIQTGDEALETLTSDGQQSNDGENQMVNMNSIEMKSVNTEHEKMQMRSPIPKNLNATRVQSGYKTSSFDIYEVQQISGHKKVQEQISGNQKIQKQKLGHQKIQGPVSGHQMVQEQKVIISMNDENTEMKTSTWKNQSLQIEDSRNSR